MVRFFRHYIIGTKFSERAKAKRLATIVKHGKALSITIPAWCSNTLTSYAIAHSTRCPRKYMTSFRWQHATWCRLGF